MNWRDIKNLDKDDFLEALGLQTRPSTMARILSLLGTFGAGMLVGAGLGMLFAPRRGSELREQIGQKLRRAPEQVKEKLGMGEESSSYRSHGSEIST